MNQPLESKVRDWNSSDQLLAEWRKSIVENQSMHYQSASYFENWGRSFGILVIIMTTVVGSTIFATMDKEENETTKIILGLVSLTAAMLSGMQTFLGHKERAEKHRSAGAQLGVLLRGIDLMRSLPFESRDGAKEFMVSIKDEWDTISTNLPVVPSRIYNSIRGR